MIAFFKYDNGNAFTLNGNDYYGIFHVQNGVAYTGKIHTDTSEILTPKGNFLSESYLNEISFNYNAELTSPNIYTLDLLDYNTLYNLLEKINLNNLQIFQNLIKPATTPVKFDPRVSHFYGLSSTPVDSLEDDELYGKNVYTHIDPFSYSPEWSFLDTITSGVLLPNSEDDSFIYYCTDGVSTYTLKGSFVNKDKLELVQHIEDEGGSGYFYQNENEIIEVTENSINFYNRNSQSYCGELVLVDKISNTVPASYLKYVKFGNKYRIELDELNLQIKEKLTSNIVKTISFSELSIIGVNCITIRDADDYIAMVSTENELLTFHPDDFENTLNRATLDISNPKNIEFHSFDSDIIVITDSDNVLNNASVKTLGQVTGKYTSGNLLYLDDYYFNRTNEQFNNILLKWNSNSMKSNYFNNLVYADVANNGNYYFLMHNIGRIYVSKSRITDALFDNLIPLDLEKNYTGLDCGASSVGLSINAMISNIVKDILSLYSKSSAKISGLENATIDELKFDSYNLQIHTNETLNATTLQRIFEKIIEIQNTIYSGS